MHRSLRRRRRAEDGAAAVEFALLFPIFMVLALGLIAGGTAYSKQINVTQAAREASRYGATLDILSTHDTSGTHDGTISTWLPMVDQAVTQVAGSQANPIGGYDYRCVAYVTTKPDGSVDTGHSWYSENGGAVQAAPDSTHGCPSTQAAKIAGTWYVQVVLSRRTHFFVLFANPTLHLDAVSVTPYEGTTKP